MKRIIALLLAMIMLMSTLAGCANGHFEFEDDTRITRGEWIDALARTFGMDEYDSEKAYMSDVSPKDSIFASVQSSYEWGVLRDLSRKLKKNKVTTLEFAATTAVYATGVDISSYEGKIDSEKALNYAIQNNIVDAGLKYNKEATLEQCDQILRAAQEAYMNQEFTPVDRLVINESVGDERETGKIQEVGEGKYTFVNSVPQVGEVYIAPGNEESPDGVAIKVASVTQNGDGTYTVETITPELHEVVDEIEFADVVVPKFEDIVPAPGFTISEGVDPSLFSLNNTVSKEGYKATKMLRGTSKDEPLSFTAKADFNQGKLSFTPEWESLSASATLSAPENSVYGKGEDEKKNGEWFNKTSYIHDKSLFSSRPYKNDKAVKAYQEGLISQEELRKALSEVQNPDGSERVMVNKFKGGYEVNGSVSIKDLYIIPKIKYTKAKIFGLETAIPNGIENISMELNYQVVSSLSVKGKLEEELTVMKVPIPLTAGLSAMLELKIYAELNGEVAVKLEVTNHTKTEITGSGKAKKTSTQDASLNVDLEVEFESGPKVEIGLEFCGIEIIDVGIAAAVKIKADAGVAYSTVWSETDEAFLISRRTTTHYGIVGHVPIINLEIGMDKESLAYKVGLKFKWKLVGEPGSDALSPTAKKFDIVPEREDVIWEEQLTLPKDLEEADEAVEEAFGGQNKGHLGIEAYYIYLEKGESKEIAIEKPEGYADSDFIWSSSDASVVTVKNGKISAKKEGSAMITVETKDGKYLSYCAIYVDDSANDSISNEFLPTTGHGGGGGSF